MEVIEMLTSLIQNVGFPIACVIAMFHFWNKEREDLKSELATWGRADMFTPMSRRAIPEHCTSFHEIRQCANGFFDMPDDLF